MHIVRRDTSLGTAFRTFELQVLPDNFLKKEVERCNRISRNTST